MVRARPAVFGYGARSYLGQSHGSKAGHLLRARVGPTPRYGHCYNAEDQKREVAVAMRVASAPFFCIFMLVAKPYKENRYCKDLELQLSQLYGAAALFPSVGGLGLTFGGSSGWQLPMLLGLFDPEAAVVACIASGKTRFSIVVVMRPPKAKLEVMTRS